MKQIITGLSIVGLLAASNLNADELCEVPSCTCEQQNEEKPATLYKVISMQAWTESQQEACVKLADMDNDFIHFATAEQLDRVIEKYWKDTPEFVVLKIETSKLAGELACESNPGGSNKYYHLYNGQIPLEAVVDSKVVKN